MTVLGVPYTEGMPLSPSFPELAALDLYASVVEHGSLGAAARAHGIAQPSASSRIKNLERQLGVQLLDRSPTGSKPTPVGIVVAGWADAILRAAGELEAGLTALKAEEQGRLRIAASYTIAEYLLPNWLGRFLADHPEDTVSLDVENSTAVLRGLEAGEAANGPNLETPVWKITSPIDPRLRDPRSPVLHRAHTWQKYSQSTVMCNAQQSSQSSSWLPSTNSTKSRTCHPLTPDAAVQRSDFEAYWNSSARTSTRLA